MIKFAVVNLGCRVNRAESDMIEKMMSKRGIMVDKRHADIIFINTCTVTSTADKKTRKVVSSTLRENDKAKIVVVGCAANMYPEYFRSLDERVEVADKFKLLSDLDDLSDNSATSNQARVNVKIQDGCDNACTYCIVHTARGKSRSMSKDKVISTCKNIDKQGVPEIVLTGINLGTYADPSLEDLLCELLRETQNVRYRISSIEPMSINDELLDVIKSSKGRVCKHFHLPLQSGSEAILRAMDRHYSAKSFVELTSKIYRYMPEFSLSTDVIVGFPGESESDFIDTLNVAKAARFSKIHVFPYSKRDNTPAASMKNQISSETKAERAKILRQFAEGLRKQEFKKRVGTIENVVVENDEIATTESYFTISSPKDAALNTSIKIKLEEDMFIK